MIKSRPNPKTRTPNMNPFQVKQPKTTMGMDREPNINGLGPVFKINLLNKKKHAFGVNIFM